jgi:Protein of unknown function (DUF2452)
MSKKKPDLVVWDEERGYYPRELTFGSNLGAPAIQADNVDGWKLAKIKDVNTEFETRYNELLVEAQKLKDEYEWNRIIYTEVKYNFQPIIGKIYHLYTKEDDTMFLSIIDPSSWKMKYIGSFKLNSANKWVKL